ncbi:MAG: hypothetical protein K2Z81_04545 [Cyanobacteria bacterium]|nr:hypothetical protein [Cyanobacteriota bacterium]
MSEQQDVIEKVLRGLDCSHFSDDELRQLVNNDYAGATPPAKLLLSIYTCSKVFVYLLFAGLVLLIIQLHSAGSVFEGMAFTLVLLMLLVLWNNQIWERKRHEAQIELLRRRQDLGGKY